MKVIDVGNRFILNGLYTKAFLKSVKYKTKFHEDAENGFYVVYDEYKYAMGITWFCKKCRMEVWQYENLATNFNTYVLTELVCHNCGNTFLHEGTESELTTLKFLWEIHTGCWRKG